MVKQWSWVAVVLGVALASPAAAQQVTGNGAISGSHFNLNLLGKDTCPGDDLKNTSRHTIMVKLNFRDDDPDGVVGDDPGNIATLDRTNKIFLAMGDFAVTDGNACDGDGAAFTLPNPYECGDPNNCEASYAVFVRELGKPGGTGDIRTCGISDSGTPEDTTDDEVVCSSEQLELERKAGRSRFRNVTKQLTTLDLQVDTDGDGILEEVTVGLFDPLLYQYYWDYDNNGLRLVQLRFYPIPAE